MISAVFSLIAVIITPIVIPVFLPNYVSAIIATQILGLASIPNTVVLLYLSKFLGGEKSKFVLIGNVGITLFYLFSIIVFGHIYQLIGISLAYLISYTVYAVFLAVMDRRNTKIMQN